MRRVPAGKWASVQTRCACVLAVCSGIVKEHDGWIDVDSADGGGTVFTVYVPA